MSASEHKIKVLNRNCLLPREIVAVMLNVSEGTLSNWMKSDDPPPYNRIEKKFPARELGDWIRQRQTVRQGQGGGYPFLPDGVVMTSDTLEGSTKRDYQTERTRKEAATADKLELELALKRGEVVLAETVEKGWTDVLSRLKVRLLRVPYSVAAQLTGETDHVKMQSGVKDIMEDALIELSAGWQPSDEREEDDYAA